MQHNGSGYGRLSGGQTDGGEHRGPPPEEETPLTHQTYSEVDFSPLGARRMLALQPRVPVTQESAASWVDWIKLAEGFMNAAQEFHNRRPARGYFIDPETRDVERIRRTVEQVGNCLRGLTSDGSRRVGRNSAGSLSFGA